MVEFVVALAIASLIAGVSLFIGTKIAGVHATLFEVVLIAVISSLFTTIPKVGGPFGAVIMLVLLSKWTDAEFWPHAMGNVLVAQILAVSGMYFLTPLVLGMIA